MMKLLAASLIGIALLAPSATVLAADTKSTADASAAGTEKAVNDYRDQMQAKRADVMAKALTLSADQASKFWPLFEKYQKEQNVIIDGQIKAIQQYAANYDKLTDAQAVAFVKALLDRDAKMEALRTKWLESFQAAVPARTVARVIQVDRRLSQLAQAQLSSQIPLVPAP
jgi:Spy/CpxP family protein refolding chaperone